jgi:hypothetical protein
MPIRHGARLEAIQDHLRQVGVAGWLVGRGGLVCELAQREVARPGDQRRCRRAVATPVRPVAHGAALRIHTLAEWRIGGEVSAGRPGQVGIHCRRGLPDLHGAGIPEPGVDRAPEVEDY